MAIGPVNIGDGDSDTAEELMKQHLEAKNPHNITAQDVGADLAGAAQNALKDAKTYMDGKISELGTGVSSFNGRTGGVTPQTGDYTAEMVGAVPTTRMVNNKPLSADIELSASDVKAVPTTRKINNKPLSADIELSASDVGAVGMQNFTFNVPISSWSEDSGYYFATVSVPGIKATDDPEYVDIQRSSDYAADDLMSEQFALVMSMTTTDNKIKLRAVEKPTLALKIRMKVFRG